MIDDLRSIVIFARTVEAGSFRAAASALGLSPSVVSYCITQLEKRLGVALLYRSTRRLSLTDDGKNLMEHAKIALDAAEAGMNALASRSSEPTGVLTLTVPAFFTRATLISDIASFAQLYPKIRLLINFTDLKQDLIQSGIDLAIRIGALESSSLKCKKLSELKRKLVTAPGYAAGRTPPSTPKDLANWDWIGLHMRPNHRLLRRKDGKGKVARVDFDPRIMVDSVDAACQLAIAGLGLTTPPEYMVQKELREGDLIGLLPEWEVESLGIYAVWPPNAPRESLTMRLLRYLEMREIERCGVADSNKTGR